MRHAKTRQRIRKGLVPQKRTVRGGVTRTYWVKPTQSAPADLSALVGTSHYYLARAVDHKRRTGKQPPAYYMQYGNKYAARFTRQTTPKLSHEGRVFVQKARLELHKALERKRRQAPTAFARLENDPEKLRKFAYSTHAPAYIRAGVSNLSARDYWHIAMTPDTRDLLTRDGLKQAAQVAGHVLRRKVRRYS